MRYVVMLMAGLALPTAVRAQPPRHPGLLFDDGAYARAPYQNVVVKATLPSRVSFEAYCPPVQDQGRYSTCAGFACGYYLCTIVDARAARLRSRADIGRRALSPSYLYEKIKASGDYACAEGAHLTRAFDFLRDTGTVRFDDFPYPGCGHKTGTLDRRTDRYRIRSYERLFELSDPAPRRVARLRQALADGDPVVIGLVIPPSFYFAGKLWSPAPGETPTGRDVQGHALCVVGYDDRQFGGSFRVVNSFGTDWADGGFCWITYRDMGRFVRYGYKITPR